MQRVIGGSHGKYRFLDLPDPAVALMPGVRWGSFEHALTPAFWVSQAWLQDDGGDLSFELAPTLREEVVYCLLGGHGAPAEVGLAASKRVLDALAEKADGVLGRDRIETMLLEPLWVNGKLIHYRFARQRAKYLTGALEGLRHLVDEELDDLALRDALRDLPGIGPKTASWIVRNRRASDRVAILDVHIIRACEHMGVFPRGANLARSYMDLERRFLEFCEVGGVRASVLDAVMWGTMRRLGRRMLASLIDTQDCFGERLPLLQWGAGECQETTPSGTMATVG
ncbi:endonuclease III domain-containing protein [Caulobacter segnis]|uniref:endonuclease III domain-containing protein n=1 Tax=Caulobacter segnis TaxID=88688 RepID=UPI00285D4CAB|nr:endonuclease III domain-containing protein [Caulobacter segnis]MDR6623856.1 thermostable 8-oxoguanine DNA glycosylase [Caulobacter segnis]